MSLPIWAISLPLEPIPLPPTSGSLPINAIIPPRGTIKAPKPICTTPMITLTAEPICLIIGTRTLSNTAINGTMITSTSPATISRSGDTASKIPWITGARGVMIPSRTVTMQSINGSRDLESVSSIGERTLKSFLNILSSGFRTLVSVSCTSF